MVAVKKKKENSKISGDASNLLSDVASFASSLGFSAAAGDSSGFNDSDFRRAGPIKTKLTSLSPPTKNPPAKKFDGKRPKRSVGVGNRERVIRSKTEPDRIGPVEEPDDDRFKNLPDLPLVKHGSLGVWHRDATELEEKIIGKDKSIEYSRIEEWKSFVETKKEFGQRLLAQYVRDYWSSRGQHNDIKMLVSSLKSGTAADKVSAMSVLIGDNPLANLRSIDSLSGMVTSKIGKRHAFAAFQSLQEIFLILLPDRKLKALYQRPLNHLPENKEGYSLLLFWYWEESLKDRYERFVSALEEASVDTVTDLKNLSLKTTYVLLKNKSEQERRLLSLLVNKLGDPENKVASNADYHLTNLLSEHPNMKAVVIDEVDNFLFRPHLGPQAKYHAVNFLSQIRLSHKGDGPKVAKRLVDIYFALFKVLVSEASLSPSVEKNDKRRRETSNETHSNAKGASPSEMDSRLLSSILTGVNRAFPYLHSDEADDVVQAQTPLLFQMVHSKNFNVGVQALMLLDKISSKNQIVSDRFYRALYSKLVLPSAMISSKEEMLIALILRAMKNDVNLKRVAAFSKRLLQVALQLSPQYACGFLFLLSEVLKARPPLWSMMLQNGVAAADDDLEHFEDIKDDDAKSSASSSDDEQRGRVLPDHDSVTSSYKPGHREPSYCNADGVGWWELTLLAAHVHPSVAAMARTLLSGVNIVYNGNPLIDLSLAAFLDKFMEKKPKPRVWHGASQIEPAKKLDASHGLIGADILTLEEGDVPPEDVVFHKFYVNKMNSTAKRPKKKNKKKNKKSAAEDEATEELYAVNGGGDEDDDEEEVEEEETEDEEEMEEGDYDYDDLDKVAGEEDEELIEDGSDPEIDDDVDVEVGDQSDVEFEDGDEEEKSRGNKKKKSKSFASLDDYKHLIDAVEEEKSEVETKNRKKRRKNF